MSDIPDSNLSEEQKLEFHANLFLNDLIRYISVHICSKPLSNSFYNFSDFFLKCRIDNDDVKTILKNRIIELLKNKQYHLAYVFNKTGLIICENEDQLNDSVWKSNLDFTKL